LQALLSSPAAAITDALLQRLGILSIPQEVRFTSAQALIALSYHVAYVALGSYLAARLAPMRTEELLKGMGVDPPLRLESMG
jgi:hypothetical protein